MHKRFNPHGFTIVEMLVVITVIIVLSTVGMLGYENINKQSNDAKRDSDIIALQHELEKYYQKHGEYPAGCPTTSCTTGDPNVVFNSSSPQTLTSNITIEQLRTVLPGLSKDFGDPLDDGNYPLLDKDGSYASSSSYRYLYFGGLVNASGSTQLYKYRLTGSPFFNCPINVNLEAGQVSSYFIAYYSEQDNPKASTPDRDRWHLLMGSQGSRFDFDGAYPDANGNRTILFCSDGPWSGGTIDN